MRPLSINVDNINFPLKPGLKDYFFLYTFVLQFNSCLCKESIEVEVHVMNEQKKTTEELKKEIEVLRLTVETQKKTINTLLNQYVLKNIKRNGK